MRAARGRRRARALWSALLTLALLAIAAPAASAAPWQCDSTAYISQWDATATRGNTLFQRADRQPNGSYELTTLGQFNGRHINAIAFRPQDGLIYGIDNTARELVRIENDGSGRPTLTYIGMPGGAFGQAPIVGTVLLDGTFAIYTPNSGEGAIYDVSGPSAVLLRRLSGSTAISDWAVSPVDGKVYGSLNTGTYEIEIDVAAGTIRQGARVADGRAAGGQWFLPDGTLMLYDNVNNPPGIWKVDLTTGAATRLGSAPAASNVDAASCAFGLAVEKDVTPRTVTAGGELQYTFRIVNRALTDGAVALSDVLPAGLTYVPGSVTVTPALLAPNAYGGTSTLTLGGTLASRQNVTVTARVHVAPTHACDVDVANTAHVTLSVPGLPSVTVSSDDPTTPDPEDPTVARVTCSADLSLAKQALTSPAHPGGQLAYHLTVRNLGPSTAHDVVVTDTLPAGLTFESVSSGCAVNGAAIRCALGTLAPGAHHTFEVVTRVAANATGNLVNTATVASRTPDPNLGNNRAGSTVPVEPLADLAIAKRALSSRLVPGRTLAYELVVVNDGPSTARDVVVTDVLPRGLTFRSASDGCAFADGTVTCRLGDLAAGASVTLRIETTVASSVGRKVVNTATVSSPTRDPDPSDNTSTEQVPPGPEADLSLVKSSSVRSVVIGQQHFYTLVVKNSGPSDAADVTVEDVADLGLKPLAARASQGSCTVAGQTVRCQLGTIAAGGHAQVLVSARADHVGELVNQARVTSSTPDPDPSNNRSSTSVPSGSGPVPPAADLTIVKSANRRAVTGNQTVTYTLRVTNRGPGVATGVTVVDTPSLPLQVRSVRASQGTCQQALPVSCALGALRAGQTATVTIVAQPRAAGTLRNSASVTGEQPDPNPADNIDGASVPVRGQLAVTKTADRRTVRAGGTVGYRIRVVNRSPFALRNVRVCDRLPSGLAYVKATPAGRLTSGNRCWTYGQLGAGKAQTIRVTARVTRDTAGTKVNRVSATAPGARGASARSAVRVIAVAGVRAGGVTG